MQHTSQAHQPATSQPAAQREAQPGNGSLSAQLAHSPRQAAQRRQLQDLRAGPVQRAEGLCKVRGQVLPFAPPHLASPHFPPPAHRVHRRRLPRHLAR